MTPPANPAFAAALGRLVIAAAQRRVHVYRLEAFQSHGGGHARAELGAEVVACAIDCAAKTQRDAEATLN